MSAHEKVTLGGSQGQHTLTSGDQQPTLAGESHTGVLYPKGNIQELQQTEAEQGWGCQTLGGGESRAHPDGDQALGKARKRGIPRTVRALKCRAGHEASHLSLKQS